MRWSGEVLAFVFTVLVLGGCRSKPEVALPAPPLEADARLLALRTLDDRHAFTPPATLDAWERRADELRRRVLVSAGLWPMPERPAVRATLGEPVPRDGYTVTSVSFESLPGHVVTGSLYRPTGRGPGPLPAVLSPHGHWADGRFSERTDEEVRAELDAGAEVDPVAARYHLQARCVQLARMGAVVFHHDMVGYGDSRQLAHKDGLRDLEAESRLQSFFGLQTWNSLRALDFLCSLPFVDAERIGVTGASGGGTQTLILCAIDPRPKVAFPAVMVSTGMQGGCVCENASHLRVGTDNVELAALFAPKPLALSGANDWTLDIERDGLPELRAVWRLFGVPNGVQAFVHPEFEHNFNAHSRRDMARWFARHLGLEQGLEERPFEPLSRAELSVGNPPGTGGADAVRAWMGEQAAARLHELDPEDVFELVEARRVIGGALRTLVATELPANGEVSIRIGERTSANGAATARLVLRRRDREGRVPARLATPAGWDGEVVVALGLSGAQERSLLDAGKAVLRPAGLLDEAQPLPVDAARHADYVGFTFGYNRTLLSLRVEDILTAVAAARDMPGVTAVHLAALGEHGPRALYARVLARDVVEELVVEWSSAFDRVASFDDEDFLPGLAKYGGLDRLLALNAPFRTTVVGTNILPKLAKDAYRAAARTSMLRLVPDEEAALAAVRR